MTHQTSPLRTLVVDDDPISRALLEELALRHQESLRLTSELISLNKRLSDLAVCDELTALGNRRQAMHKLEEHCAIAIRYGRPLSYALLDVDQFKQFNDSHGHAV